MTEPRPTPSPGTATSPSTTGDWGHSSESSMLPEELRSSFTYIALAFHERCGIYKYFMTQVRNSGQRDQVQCPLPLEKLDRRGDQLGLQLLPNQVSPHLRLSSGGKYQSENIYFVKFDCELCGHNRPLSVIKTSNFQKVLLRYLFSRLFLHSLKFSF